jgi:hypothetical protein
LSARSFHDQVFQFFQASNRTGSQRETHFIVSTLGLKDRLVIAKGKATEEYILSLNDLQEYLDVVAAWIPVLNQGKAV